MGPISSHCRSSLVACFPRVRLSFGIRRWTIDGKNPSILEKLCSVRVGVILICLVVVVASARAMRRPAIVTVRAAILRERGIVIIGVFDGRKFEVIIKPAIILPQARRSIDAMTSG